MANSDKRRMRTEKAEDGRVRDHCNPPRSLHLYRGCGFTHRKCFIKRMVGLEFTELIFNFIGCSLQIILPHLSCLTEQMYVSGGRIEKYSLRRSLGHYEMGLKNHFHQHVPTSVCVCDFCPRLSGHRSLSLLRIPCGIVWWLSEHYLQISIEELPLCFMSTIVEPNCL